MSRIDIFLDSLEKAFERAGDKVPWPVHVATIAPYFADPEASDLYSKIKFLANQDTPISAVKKLFIGPSSTRSTLMDMIIGLKATEPAISADERMWFVEYMFDVIQEMLTGDLFCRDGRHLILNSQEAQALYEKTPWNRVDPQLDICRSIHRVSASLHALMWSLYFYGWSDVGFEFHGPYEITSVDGTELKLIVRDFFDTKPILLWESMETFPFNSLRILTLYERETDINIDIFNHIVSRTNLLDATVGIYIEANGIVLKTQEEVEDLRGQISQRVLEQHRLVRSMSREELVKKFIETRYYVFRKLRNHFQEDWRPPTDVLRRISDWGLIEIPQSGPPNWNLLRRAFDPRNDFIL